MSKVVLFCASHIANIDRLNQLEQTIFSWSIQTYKTQFYISISCIDIDYIQDWISMIVAKYNNLFIYLSTNHHTQMEHYRRLLRLFQPSNKEIWISFVDDDDTIQFKRLECFYNLISRFCKNIDREKAIVRIFPTGSKMWLITHVEYVHFCIRIDLFQLFFDQLSDERISSHNADCDLVKFLLPNSNSHHLQKLYLFVEDNKDISYNYTNCKYTFISPRLSPV